MAGISLLHALCLLLCLLIVLFYLFRLIGGYRWASQIDVENEVGHGLMAAGMGWMLAPGNFLNSSLLLWNSVLFGLAALWWTGRLLIHKPLLALIRGRADLHSPVQSDVIHIFTQGGMCYMFLLMSSMSLSMNPLVRPINYFFFAAFVCLTVFYGREVTADLRQAKISRLQLGANIAHVLMNGIMSWMFLEMISMTLTMSPS